MQEEILSHQRDLKAKRETLQQALDNDKAIEETGFDGKYNVTYICI